MRWKADVIVAAGGAPSAARKVTATIPIVVASGVDLVAAGLAESLARPGGNVTGLSILGPELITKRLEILKDVVPKLSRVGVLMRAGASAGSGQQQQMEEIRAAATALKLTLQELPTELDTGDIERMFKTAVKEHVGAIIPTAGRLTFAARKPIAQLAIKYKLPGIYQEQEFVDDGGLMSYGPDFSDLYRHAAYYVDKIIEGNKTQRSARRAAEEVRVRGQSENRQADRPDDPTECAGAGGSGDSIKTCKRGIAQRAK